MPIHLVRQGEHLSAIAARHRMSSTAIWQHPDNEGLRQRRANPNMLAPGDVLYVPDPEPSSRLPFAASSTNRFSAVVPRVKVEVLLRRGDEPLAGVEYEAHGVGVSRRGKTESDGRAALEVPVHVRHLRLVVPGEGLELPLVIGGLDPIDEPSGIDQRLAHLGFGQDAAALALERSEAPEAGSAGAGALTPERLRRRALAAFQHARGLDSTGELDDATRAALERAYGS